MKKRRLRNEAPLRPEVAASMKTLADAIKRQIPTTHGFALLVFDMHTNNGNVSYISNGERADMKKVMRELIGRWEADEQLEAN